MCIRLAPTHLQALDRLRGDRSRTQFIEQLIEQVTAALDQTAENQARGVVTTSSATGLNLDRQAAEHDHRYSAGSSGILACTICGKLKP